MYHVALYPYVFGTYTIQIQIQTNNNDDTNDIYYNKIITTTTSNDNYDGNTMIITMTITITKTITMIITAMPNYIAFRY